MIFWIVCVLLALAVAAVVTAPLWRGVQDVALDPDVAFYRAQLAELDRDVERGTIDATEGERARVEVQRRLLAADGRSSNVAASAPSPVLAVGILAVLIAAGLVGYWQLGAIGYPDLPLKSRIAMSEEMRLGRPNQVAMEAAARPQITPEVPADYLASVEQLRKMVPTRSDDLKGWELLSYHEAQMRNFPAAVDAQAQVLELKDEAATNEDRRVMVDLMVTAADGLVSPETELIVRQILAKDAANQAANYYYGALYYQTDRADIAFRLWQPIVADGDPQSYYVAAARSQIEDAAFRAGVKYTLPEVRGPSAADIANATDLSEGERQAMIRGMVNQLASRLAEEGGPASDWARLIGAYGVLGEVDKATEVWLEASEVFAGSEGAMTALRAAADAAGVQQ